jgi:hypothetical protein
MRAESWRARRVGITHFFTWENHVTCDERRARVHIKITASFLLRWVKWFYRFWELNQLNYDGELNTDVTSNWRIKAEN